MKGAQGNSTKKEGRYRRDEAGKKRGAVTGRDGRESGSKALEQKINNHS